MKKSELYSKVLDEVSIDPRLDSGIFDVLNDTHLSIFREYLIKEGEDEELAILASNKLAESGKHPERQAYNKDGLLVTFPSPEYKQRAISRGTHFEKNPKIAQTNLFGGETTPQAQPSASVKSQPTVPQTQQVKAEPVNPDNRTPEERQQNAVSVEKILKTEGKNFYTLEEATTCGFYVKEGTYYTPDGEKVGKLWYVVDKNQQLILPD
jgi:hypothetical protein